ncbi:MAG: catalase/peroxidase HPI [Proteobacteria bacterium]|nr:catalase/peroxidase HPI [Pseudomonadota bacterium]
MTIRKITLFLVTLSLTVGCSLNLSKKNDQEFAARQAKPNEFWWPNKVDLSPLRQHAKESNPLGDNFNYAREFRKVNLTALKKDIKEAMTTSQDWWPADFGNYGPFFIRMAWHSAGTYRVADGRGGAGGGQQRFEPLNSWPDNGNLDKARRLLWPVKKKYGRRVSWADLMVLAGNVALESMGFETVGFAGGRADDWEPDLVYWGPEKKFLDSKRHGEGRKLEKPLGATRMGLIYVNPEGPNGDPDPIAAAHDIRETFGNMAMNDEETVALIAGGHTFGKAHGAHDAAKCLGAEPAAAPIEEQGFGWKNKCGSGKGEDAVTSGLEGAWTTTPTTWSNQYLDNLFTFEWVKTKSPSGATQWIPKDKNAANLVPDAHNSAKRHAPIMFTTDLSLKFDPEYSKIAKRFQENPEEFKKAFAKAWFKLTHRDMGPKARYIGREVPRETFAWQDPVPKVRHRLINAEEAIRLKQQILKSGLSNADLVRTAWAAASSYRNTDMRGGANGARVALAPQKDWAVNDPEELNRVITRLKKVRKDFNKTLANGKQVSLADVIVAGGAAAIEKAARSAGVRAVVPFKAGRGDATQEQTDVQSFAVLEPKADGFRNYYNSEAVISPVNALIDKANTLDLTVPQMTALIGGMRALGANSQGSKHGVLTNREGVLSNDFFVNLLDMSVEWKKSKTSEGVYEAYDRKTGEKKWSATSVDLVFGSSSELRAIAEVYASNDGKRKFIRDFVEAWDKVMKADRFDLKK